MILGTDRIRAFCAFQSTCAETTRECSPPPQLKNPQTPAEPTLTAHVKSLREFLDRGHIRKLLWLDNRDMVADPLTKGKTKRNELNEVLDHGQ